MSTAVRWPIRFQVGARTLWQVRRRLVRVPLTLQDVLAGQSPALPPLSPGDDGWSVTSLPETLAGQLATAEGIRFIRQRYVRYHTDLTLGFAGWEATLSGNARSSLRRAAKRMAAAGGGTLDVRRYRTSDAMAEFHTLARRVAATTYQERLLGAALPADEGFVATMLAGAAAGKARGWIAFVGDRPVAYLYCPVADGIARYDYVGHDPDFAELSPGAVLMVEAMRDLQDDDDARLFDFTEGEGRHKRRFATGGTACVDLLLLRPTLANRATVAALATFDGAVAWAKRARRWPAAAALIDRVRRG